MGDADNDVVIPVQEIEAWMDETLEVVDEGLDNLYAFMTNLNEKTKQIFLQLRVLDSFRKVFVALNFLVVPVVTSVLLLYGVAEGGVTEFLARMLVGFLMFIAASIGAPYYVYSLWETYCMAATLEEEFQKMSKIICESESSLDRLAHLLSHRMPPRMRSDLDRRLAEREVYNSELEDDVPKLEDKPAEIENHKFHLDRSIELRYEPFPTESEIEFDMENSSLEADFPVMYQLQFLVKESIPELNIRFEKSNRNEPDGDVIRFIDPDSTNHLRRELAPGSEPSVKEPDTDEIRSIDPDSTNHLCRELAPKSDPSVKEPDTNQIRSIDPDSTNPNHKNLGPESESREKEPDTDEIRSIDPDSTNHHHRELSPGSEPSVKEPDTDEIRSIDPDSTNHLRRELAPGSESREKDPDTDEIRFIDPDSSKHRDSVSGYKFNELDCESYVIQKSVTWEKTVNPDRKETGFIRPEEVTKKMSNETQPEYLKPVPENSIVPKPDTDSIYLSKNPFWMDEQADWAAENPFICKKHSLFARKPDQSEPVMTSVLCLEFDPLMKRLSSSDVENSEDRATFGKEVKPHNSENSLSFLDVNRQQLIASSIFQFQNYELSS